VNPEVLALGYSLLTIIAVAVGLVEARRGASRCVGGEE
jgi:hypothetical protein